MSEQVKDARPTIPEWLQRAVDERHIERLEDGFYYFFPVDRGALASHHLRALADKLDEMNAEWEATVAKALAALPPAPISMEGFELTEPPDQSTAAS